MPLTALYPFFISQHISPGVAASVAAANATSMAYRRSREASLSEVNARSVRTKASRGCGGREEELLWVLATVLQYTLYFFYRTVDCHNTVRLYVVSTNR